MKNKLIPYLYTISIILIGSIIISLLYYFNITSEKINKLLIYAISSISIFIGAFKMGIISNKKGLITGILYYLVWFIISFLITIIFLKNISITSFIYYLLLLIFSMIGSIIGKNKKKED